ncbi:MAG: hypothetical protein ACI8Q3_001533 [Marinomonas primoryensis]|jgi:hypothetical protein
MPTDRQLRRLKRHSLKQKKRVQVARFLLSLILSKILKRFSQALYLALDQAG